MNDQIAQWQKKWQNLPANDRRALSVLGLFAAGVFIIFGLFQPAKHFFERAQSGALASRELVEWINNQKPQLQRLQSAVAKTNPQTEGTLLQRATTVAKSRKIEIKRFEPEGDTRIRLWIDEVRYQDLQLWLDDLLQQKVVIRSLNIDALGDAGMVSSRLTLEG
ncbi:MAG: type II secretion system protein M [Gammaproteobacteria bacterium]|nr:type II secretion system protein M [Gammaproteobacteria bacterium]